MNTSDREAVQDAIKGAMSSIREDVAMGLGGNIEADAVALMIGESIADYLARFGDFDRDEFMKACDLVDLLPSEAFHSY